MTKDVLISITGMHTDAIGEGDLTDEPIEVITPASYFFKNGKHYILYDEVAEGIPGVTKNQVKITGDQSLEIMKRGLSNTHMVFEKGKKHITSYNTPFGELMMEIHTADIQVREEEDEIRVHVQYGLDVNDEPVAECAVKLLIKSKKPGVRM